MDWFIKKNATLPVLKLGIIKDGRSDYNNFMELLETSTIFFSMVNVETGIPKIMSKPAGFVEKTFIDPNAEPEYYIYYQFTNTDTNLIGKYEGQFLVKTDDGNLILPIREKLFIYVQESFIADDLTYENCYTSVYPCCIGPGYPTPTPTNTPTPSVTPTPTPEQILINPIITENDEYIEVGNDEYLQYVNPTINYNIDVYVSSGSVVTTFTVTSNIAVNQITTIPVNAILNVVGGGSITITANVIILNNQLIGQSISSNPLINYNLLTRQGEINVGVITPNNFPTFITANILQFEQEPTPTPTPTPTITPTETPTPTNTQTNTPTPTPTITPTQTPPPLIDFTFSVGCSYDPYFIVVTVINLINGVPPYELGTTYFTSELDALSNTSWVTGTDREYLILPPVNSTYWVVVKDSVGNILAKSVTTNCL